MVKASVEVRGVMGGAQGTRAHREPPHERQSSRQWRDFGNSVYDADDDCPDFTILARGVSRGDVERGVLLCGSGVGASVAANKIFGVRAAVCHDDFSARPEVGDDNLNILCFGGRTIGIAVAWDCTRNFLNARFSGTDRHRRRLAKVAQLEQPGCR